MNRETRNAIERATQRSRKLLEEDFSSQLEGSFDVLRSGTIAPRSGAHLLARQKFQRDRIVAAIEHKRGAGMTPVEAVTDYVRDAAFTTLNRFVALKMLEARELLQECISKGDQSVGYREFCGMAPGVALLPESAGYRLFIESLFDELSTEVKVLFDRRDPPSVLWPKRATFEALLEVLNAADLSSVWGEDETIGWVYQFFNSDEERREMRDAAPTPRNGRELAIRNQFFTPRYVVQFLTDNTLGRMWCESRNGQTTLQARCEFLMPAPASSGVLTKRDPRDLLVLDPACGSGHFLLYAFDLLLLMYEEAWEDLEAPRSERTGSTLRESYESLQALRRNMPALILGHNLHGIDIDPRCAQIAQLALWMRAQRAFFEFGVDRTDRPVLRRSNIVVAEPIPGDAEVTAGFTRDLNPPLLSALFTELVGRMSVAGDVGFLLNLEEQLHEAIRNARTQYAQLARESGFLPGLSPLPRQGEFDLAGISDDAFFEQVEARIVEAVQQFAKSASGIERTRRRTFADDATQGLAFFELMRHRFDVVLMNPPFGYAPQACADVLGSRISDIDALFVSRAVECLRPGGRLGVITNRTQLMKPTLAAFRQECFLSRGHLEVCADLGQGVLDAMVETAAFVIAKNAGLNETPTAIFLNCLGSVSKQDCVLRFARGNSDSVRTVPLKLFETLPDVRISHWLHPHFMELFAKGRPLSADQHVAFGLSTTDNFRFLRLRWEVHSDRVTTYQQGSPVDGWVPVAKGGEYALYDGDIHLLVDWRRDGAALRAMPGAPIRNEELYGRAGITYSKRTASAFSPRVLPAGCIAEVNGPMILPRSPESLDSLAVLAVCSSRVASYLVDALVAAGDTSTAYGAAKDYIPGVIGLIPLPTTVSEAARLAVERAVRIRRELDAFDETSADYVGPRTLRSGGALDSGRFERAAKHRSELLIAGVQASWEADLEIETAYGLPVDACEELDRSVGPRPLIRGGLRSDELSRFMEMSTEQIVRNELARGNTRKDVVKNAYRFDRRLELIATLAGSGIAEAAHALLPEYCDELNAREEELSFAFGVLIGRWRSLENGVAVPRNPFDVVPAWPPVGVGAAAQRLGIVVDDEGHGDDVAKVIGVLGRLGMPEDGITDFDVRGFFAQRFFAWHLERHSQSRRKAPVYWQLATPSSTYSVWLYSHSLTKDTLYQVQNDYVAPKLAHEERRLESLRRELGKSPKAEERKTLVIQESFVEELRTLLDDIKRIVPLWNPNLDDGVVISMAPLWRLVPHHRPWQKELKAVWDALCTGEHDWAHLAMHLWPDRVVPKCAADRSLAIAHSLDDMFWVEDDEGRWKARTAPLKPLDELIRGRSSHAVKTALKSLLDAPTTSGTGRARDRRAASSAAAERGSR